MLGCNCGRATCSSAFVLCVAWMCCSRRAVSFGHLYQRPMRAAPLLLTECADCIVVLSGCVDAVLFSQLTWRACWLHQRWSLSCGVALQVVPVSCVFSVPAQLLYSSMAAHRVHLSVRLRLGAAESIDRLLPPHCGVAGRQCVLRQLNSWVLCIGACSTCCRCALVNVVAKPAAECTAFAKASMSVKVDAL